MSAFGPFSLSPWREGDRIKITFLGTEQDGWEDSSGRHILLHDHNFPETPYYEEDLTRIQVAYTGFTAGTNHTAEVMYNDYGSVLIAWTTDGPWEDLITYLEGLYNSGAENIMYLSEMPTDYMELVEDFQMAFGGGFADEYECMESHDDKIHHCVGFVTALSDLGYPVDSAWEEIEEIAGTKIRDEVEALF